MTLPENLWLFIGSAIVILVLWLLARDLFRHRLQNPIPLARDIVFENLADAIVVLDEGNRIMDFNPSAARVLGLTSSARGKAVDAVHARPLIMVEELQRDNRYQKEVGIGESPTLYYELRLTPMQSGAGAPLGWVVVLRDITDRAKLMDQVRHIGRYDGLTGILNRSEFMELVRQKFELHQQNRNYQLSYIALDIDDFKAVNDAHGPAAGDKVLSAFAVECQRQLRTSDIFGRIGEDAFAILSNARLPEARSIAERLRQNCIKMETEVAGEKARITISLGVANTDMLPGDTPELETLMQLADQALNRAKRAGKNRVEI
jgi:diguanylate cyclase (GGDEF)-like protein/PAS domain S-box-containing protein